MRDDCHDTEAFRLVPEIAEIRRLGRSLARPNVRNRTTMNIPQVLGHRWHASRRAHVERLFAHYCRRAEPAGAER